jgi:formylglycine-generating enzyme required for sulfatase activity
VILIVFFFGWFALTTLWVLNDARRIRREREQTRAINSRSGAGDMVWIPPGKFTMGATDGGLDEQPLHDVKMRGFFIDRTEVTNTQFAQFVSATSYRTMAEREPAAGATQQAGGYVFKPGEGLRFVAGANWRHPEGPQSDLAGREDFPVVQICWEDALAYAKWAGKRLPTEAEWEYAARGGIMHAAFVWGTELKPGGRWQANVWQGRFPVEDSGEDGFKEVAPVGKFSPNNYGLADMAGNVWEWCADWYRADYYKSAGHDNPPGPDASEDPDEPGIPKRVARGGSFLSSETNGAGFRPAARMKAAPNYAAGDLGFRCARSGQ